MPRGSWEKFPERPESERSNFQRYGSSVVPDAPPQHRVAAKRAIGSGSTDRGPLGTIQRTPASHKLANPYTNGKVFGQHALKTSRRARPSGQKAAVVE